MHVHETNTRVRYVETDQMGFLHHGNYAAYYELGRTESVRSLGLTYRQLEEEHGVWMPVVSMEMRFVRPALYDDLLTIRTELRQLPKDYIVFHVEIRNEAGKLVNGGRIRLCFLDAESRKRIPAPAVLIQKLKPYFERS